METASRKRQNKGVYMYGGGSNVLKEKSGIQLIQTIRHSHGFLASGRGTIKTKVTYSIQYSNQTETENYTGVYNLTNKSLALRVFNKAVKAGAIHAESVLPAIDKAMGRE